MVSLKEYKREAIKTSLFSLLSKVASTLDDSDVSAVISRGIGLLDEIMYHPRAAVFDNACLTLKNGYIFVDVTEYRIDEICNVYFSPNKADGTIASSSLGVGIMPWLTSMWGLNFIQNVTGYTVLQGNLNKINRELCNVDDYELWPVNEDGKQLLQIRSSPDLFWLEYLPFLDSEADHWYLYSPEYQFLQEYCRCECMLRNAENVASAGVLGFGKEANELLSYWQKKEEDLIQRYEKTKIIPGLR